MEKRSYAPVFDARTIAEYAIFIAIVLVMRITHLTSIPVGPLVMTLAMIAPWPSGRRHSGNGLWFHQSV